MYKELLFLQAGGIAAGIYSTSNRGMGLNVVLTGSVVLLELFGIIHVIIN